MKMKPNQLNEFSLSEIDTKVVTCQYRSGQYDI